RARDLGDDPSPSRQPDPRGDGRADRADADLGVAVRALRDVVRHGVEQGPALGIREGRRYRPGPTGGLANGGGNRMKRTIICGAIAAALLAAALLGGSAGSGTATARAEQQWTVPGEVLVRFRDATPLAAIGAADASVGAQVVQRFQIVRNLQLVHVPGSTADAVARYQANPAVLHAHPHFPYT